MRDLIAYDQAQRAERHRLIGVILQTSEDGRLQVAAQQGEERVASSRNRCRER